MTVIQITHTIRLRKRGAMFNIDVAALNGQWVQYGNAGYSEAEGRRVGLYLAGRQGETATRRYQGETV